jgi:antitoxin (DNA-binding transcriptional repressor) of toxin-antitoxin stability system
MNSITFSQLRVARYLDQLGESLKAGETVALLRYGQVVAHFIPAKLQAASEEEPQSGSGSQP